MRSNSGLNQVSTVQVDFCQCACGARFQKRNSAVASKAVSDLLDELRCAQCSHSEHAQQAVGFDEVGDAISAQAAAYPTGLNVIFAGIAAVWFYKQLKGEFVVLHEPASGLYSYSTKPHAEVDVAVAAIVLPSQRISSASLRRLEPELEEVLRLEPMPTVNIMPKTKPPQQEIEIRLLPAPLTTDELIPAPMQTKLHTHRRQVSTCIQRARGGGNGWRWARDHRPAPLIASEAEALTPVGRGWKWLYDEATRLWSVITPSRWPESPPDADLDIPNVLEWAR